jgi:hypothetical protein
MDRSVCSVNAPFSFATDSAVFMDPYIGWRRMQRSSDAFLSAIRNKARTDVMATARDVCRNAAALRHFEPEIVPKLRPEFDESVNTVIVLAARIAAGIDDDPDNAALMQAIEVFGDHIPKFWLNSAARLRGRYQPGSARLMHD